MIYMAVSSPILCGSIAGSLGGLGIKMHNAAYRKLAIPYSYVSFEPNDLKGAINAMRCMGISHSFLLQVLLNQM